MRLRSFFSVILYCCLGLTTWGIAFAQSSSDSSTQSITLPTKDIQRFATVIEQIKRYYIEPVSDDKLFEYAISGMLSNLDPHSDYLNEDALQDLETTTIGKFGGIGIEVLPFDGFIKVISPIDNTPAHKSGLKAGDLILRIENKLVKDMTLRQAIDMIRGTPGTQVHLTVLRKDQKKPLEFFVRREVIKVPTIKTELLNDGYGYIRISFFQTSTQLDLYKAIKQLKQMAKTPLKGVIIDMRNNPGGLLDSAVDTANMFLDSKHLKYGGLIVYTKGRVPSSDIKAKATSTDILQGIPMVVLINEGSASASEVVAGALQDQNRATLVGEKTFGKASVQTVLPVDEKTALKLTTALYYTPSGRSIQAKGIEPDITVPDLTIPKSSEQDDAALSISEVDLEKHLANASGEEGESKSLSKSKTSAQNQEKDLLHSDFQLYEALNVLKGLHASVAMKTNTKN